MRIFLPLPLKFAASLLLLGAFLACQSVAESDQNDEPVALNPAAEGFNLAGSDTQAIRIADAVMAAMGGREAWDDTRFLRWNFFGARTLTWDKQGKRVRIEIPRDSMILLANYETQQGRARVGDEEITEADSLAKLMDRARRIWINDSYWLVMPFKLKDSGVTLGYVGTDTTATGEAANLLSLTFEGVGVTPQNKYHVWVSQDDQLVKQWAYFPEASDTEPRFVTPWVDYRQQGNILLSGNRGERQITDIAVMDSLPEAVFEQF